MFDKRCIMRTEMYIVIVIAGGGHRWRHRRSSKDEPDAGHDRMEGDMRLADTTTRTDRARKSIQKDFTAVDGPNVCKP